MMPLRAPPPAPSSLGKALTGERLFPLIGPPRAETEYRMLVLTRRPGEAIVLPGLGVTVRVLSVKGRCVRVGVEAPPSVAVLRDELLALPAARPPPALV